MAVKRLNDKQIKKAIEKAYGNVTAAADSLGYSPSQVRRRINGSKMLQRTLEEAREQVVDIAESKRLELIYAGDWKAIEHALRTWGAKRGHNPSNILTGPDGEALLKKHLNSDILAELISRGETAETILVGMIASINSQYDGTVDDNMADEGG